MINYRRDLEKQRIVRTSIILQVLEDSSICSSNTKKTPNPSQKKKKHISNLNVYQKKKRPPLFAPSAARGMEQRRQQQEPEETCQGDEEMFYRADLEGRSKMIQPDLLMKIFLLLKEILLKIYFIPDTFGVFSLGEKDADVSGHALAGRKPRCGNESWVCWFWLVLLIRANFCYGFFAG